MKPTKKQELEALAVQAIAEAQKANTTYDDSLDAADLADAMMAWRRAMHCCNVAAAYFRADSDEARKWKERSLQCLGKSERLRNSRST